MSNVQAIYIEIDNQSNVDFTLDYSNDAGIWQPVPPSDLSAGTNEVRFGLVVSGELDAPLTCRIDLKASDGTTVWFTLLNGLTNVEGGFNTGNCGSNNGSRYKVGVITKYGAGFSDANKWSSSIHDRMPEYGSPISAKVTIVNG